MSAISEELRRHIQSLDRLIYVRTDEDDRVIRQFAADKSARADNTMVYNPTFGLVPLAPYVSEWQTHEHAVDSATVNIHEALIKMYKDTRVSRGGRIPVLYYIILDADRWLRDAHIQRRILNIAHQQRNNKDIPKILIFLGTKKAVPENLQPYFQVVDMLPPSEDELHEATERLYRKIHQDLPDSLQEEYKGLNLWQTVQAATHSLVATHRETPRILQEHIAEYRREQIRKTDLLSIIDTSEYTFDRIGGIERFKQWVRQTKAAWTPEGRAFGLTPPKGVLAMGVWGCGKSLSVKAMGQEWGLPVIQMEMGRLRSSAVGESEANIYRATRIIESVAPCVVMIDEAEKSLSGGASSGASDAGTTSRVIGILSTWLQDTKAPVCFAMTANTVNTMPVEFINRMDERFFFNIPNEEERIEILKIHIKRVGMNPNDFNLAKLSKKAESMVGREIEQAIKTAMIESFAASKPGLDEEILSRVLQTKPRILKTMTDEVQELMSWVGFDKENNEGIRARFASGSGTPKMALH